MLPPHQKLRIIVGGMVGQFPLGGVAWDYFHYVLGLHQLGHDVYYHEDTGAWPFDPHRREELDCADYTVAFLNDFFRSYSPSLVDRWHYLMLGKHHYGMTASAFAEIAKTADIFLNVSGASCYPHDLNPRCLKVFMDTDPGYNQIMLSEKLPWLENAHRWYNLVADHDRHLTYAENIDSPDCLIPKMDFNWQPTRCVVTLPQWSAVKASPPPQAAPFTTILSWDWFRGKLIYNGVEYGTKVMEYHKFRDLPNRVDIPMALAIGSMKAPLEKIRRDGWRTFDAYAETLTPRLYQNFIANSAGEWSIAKNVYVAMNTGWFSCRTACYLAAGRPAVVQDTTWSRFVPPSDGLFAFNTLEEAIDGLNTVAADPIKHRAGAYAIAREYLAPDKVLTPMIDGIYASQPARPLHTP